MGEAAACFGWQPDELLGLHPVAPLACYDVMDLVWMLEGRRVTAIFESQARIVERLIFHWRKAEGGAK